MSPFRKKKRGGGLGLDLKLTSAKRPVENDQTLLKNEMSRIQTQLGERKKDLKKFQQEHENDKNYIVSQFSKKQLTDMSKQWSNSFEFKNPEGEDKDKIASFMDEQKSDFNEFEQFMMVAQDWFNEVIGEYDELAQGSSKQIEDK